MKTQRGVRTYTRGMSAQRDGHVRTKGRKDSHFQIKEKGLRRNQPFWHLHLRFPAYSTVKKKKMLFKLLSLLYFFMERLAK